MPQIKANGLSFEYESFGKESDPSILLIMGFSAQMTLWPVELCEGLASRGYRVIRFDNRDIGLSQKLDNLGMFNATEAFMKAPAASRSQALISSPTWRTTPSASWARSASNKRTSSAPRWAA
jgi:pimeloyl-ACP methyl ester carboxylesterase